MLDQLEQQAAVGRAAAAAAGTGVGEQSPVPARQLTFTPGGAVPGGAPAGGPPRVTPPSAGSRPEQLPTSHLGRSALQQAAALQQQEQPPQALPPLPPQHLGLQPPLQQHQLQQQRGVQVATGDKRSLAAALALEQTLAQHSPAAKQRLQPPPALPPPAPPDEPASKRLRVDGQVVAVPVPGAAQQQAGAAEDAEMLPAPEAIHAGPSAAPAAEPPRTFDYRECDSGMVGSCLRRAVVHVAISSPAGAVLIDHLAVLPAPLPDAVCSEDESEDEEAEHNLPLLSQYVQSGGRSPASARRAGARGASRSPAGAPGSGGEADVGERSPGALPGSGGPSLAQPGPDASPGLLSADPHLLESYLSEDLAAAFRKASGITGRLYDWQAECLSTPGVLNVRPPLPCGCGCAAADAAAAAVAAAVLIGKGMPAVQRYRRRLAGLFTAAAAFAPTARAQGKSLVYCAPTSGGKSLVAEVLMLRRILTTNRPAMLILPFVSICSEKSEHLR